MACTNPCRTTTAGIAGRACHDHPWFSIPRPARLRRSRSRAAEPAPHGVLAHAEAGRRGLVRHRLEVAEDDRHPVPLGEPGDLLGEDCRPRTGIDRGIISTPGPGLREPLLVPAATGLVGLRPGRDAMRDAVQPARERVPDPEGSRLPGQHEEGGLEGVLGVMLVAEHAAADAQTIDPCRSTRARRPPGAVLVPGGEPLQELGIRQPGERAQVPEPIDLPPSSPASLGPPLSVISPAVRGLVRVSL